MERTRPGTGTLGEDDPSHAPPDGLPGAVTERWATIAPHLDAIARDPGQSIRTLPTPRAGIDAAALAEPGRGLDVGPQIGEGGMGVVHAATQRALGREVAIKRLRPEARLQAGALLREAWATGAVEHPNVVPVHTLELDAGRNPLIVMKRIEGVAWSEVIRDPAEIERRFGPGTPWSGTSGSLGQAMNALAFAHHRGVLHRDVKPANVMIGDFGEVYLLDWGIAVAVDPDMEAACPWPRRRPRWPAPRPTWPPR